MTADGAANAAATSAAPLTLAKIVFISPSLSKA
jgi:hypothetical protein